MVRPHRTTDTEYDKKLLHLRLGYEWRRQYGVRYGYNLLDILHWYSSPYAYRTLMYFCRTKWNGRGMASFSMVRRTVISGTLALEDQLTVRVVIALYEAQYGSILLDITRCRSVHVRSRGVLGLVLSYRMVRSAVWLVSVRYGEHNRWYTYAYGPAYDTGGMGLYEAQSGSSLLNI